MVNPDELRHQHELAALQRSHVEIASQVSSTNDRMDGLEGSLREIRGMLKDALKLKKVAGDSEDEELQHSSFSRTAQPIFQGRRGTKVELASFDSEKVEEWVFEAREYFEWFDVPVDMRIRMISFHLTGAAYSWCKTSCYLLIGDEEMQEILKESVPAVVQTPDEANSVEVTIVQPEISFNAMVGQYQPTTFRLKGTYQWNAVMVLIDRGSSHNFVKTSVAEKLKFPIKQTNPLQVLVGNGDVIGCKASCENLPLVMQGYQFNINTFVLDLQGADIVLGVQWLMCLGFVTTHYRLLTMEFEVDGRQIKLQGDRLLQSEAISNRMLQKMMSAAAVDYLGHIVCVEGVKVDPSKIEAVQTWPRPSTLKQQRGFLGLTGYYRRFVAMYAQVAHPLTELLKKNNFHWGTEAEQAFHHLKSAMMQTPILALPDFSQQFTVETDASHRGIGAVLSQKGHLIAYFSKKLTIKMTLASAYIRELYAITQGVAKWRHYLLGRKFIIKTDHQGLRELLTQVVLTPDQQYYLAKLLGYEFEIEYRAGRLNQAADALSRHPVIQSQGSLKEANETCDKMQKLHKQFRDGKLSSDYTEIDGVMMYRGKVWVPDFGGLRELLLQELHASV
ncbi:uncharacterized protein [Arachis hypogaea]|uniref:uncharacterized protein n=1 Tax=Arachis hypogaea TaxID=3818 RepID=UPI003B20BAF9